MTTDKYAKPEIERRFVLEAVPADAVDAVEITDRYIDGGHLRLRTVATPGAAPVHKLGHKRRPDPRDAGLVMHTTIYLTAEEHALLEQLPGRELRKTRFRVDVDGRPGLVDVLHGPKEGVIILEVGFANEEDARAYEPPSWVGVETKLGGGDLAT